MDIKAEKFIITMSHEEAWQTAFDLRKAMYTTIATHWVNHQLGWKDHEKHRLHIIRTFCYSLGRPDIYDEIFTEAVKIFEAFNKKRGS